jgi:type IV secretion system protein VirD4
MSFLALYKDPVIARATSASDIRLADLMRGPAPMSLYLVVPPSDISRTRPLIRLLLNQLGRILTEDFSRKPTHPLLLLLDEMPALGRLDFLQTSLAYLAGYQIRALLVAQSLNQLDHVYGNSNSIMDACDVRVCFAPNDMKTAKTISDLLGVATEVREQSSLSGSRFAMWLSHRSVATIASPRPLMTPGEVLQLPPDDVIILRTGAPPMRAKKLKFYADPRFAARILPSPALDILDVPISPPSPWLSEKPKPVLEPPRKEAPCNVSPSPEGLPFSPQP